MKEIIRHILREETTPIKVEASIQGVINFYDLDNRKVYRYKVLARAGKKYRFDVFVKSFDETNGEFVYTDPTDNTIGSYTFPLDKLNEIKQQSTLKNNITNIFNFKTKGMKVEIDLIFVEESPIRLTK